MHTNYYDTAKFHVHVTTQLQKFKGWRGLFMVITVTKLCGLSDTDEKNSHQHKGHNVHDDFAVATAILSVMYHGKFPLAEEWL